MAFLKTKNKPEEEVKEKSGDTMMVAGSSSAARQNARNIPLIIGREFNTRVKKRGFVIATAILVVIVIAAAFAPIVIELLSSNSQSKVRVVNSAGTVAGQDAGQYVDLRLNTPIDVTGVPTAPTPNQKPAFDVKSVPPQELNALRQQVKDGKLDVVLSIARTPAGDLTFDYYTNSGPSNTNVFRVRSVATELAFSDKLARSGLPQTQLANLFQPPSFEVNSTSQERSGRSPAEQGAAYGLALASVVLLFSTIIQYGTAVAQGAVEEKSNRIMEIMVNAATPFQLMMGKIIGVGLTGLVQIGIMVAVGVGAFLVQPYVREALLGSSSDGVRIDITSISLGLLGLVLVYFVLGFLLYAGLYAAIGSLVSRQEEVQSALGPLTFVFMLGYFAAIFGLSAPEASWVTVLSFVPFFTPMLMVTRVALGNPAWWEVPVSIGIMLVAILLMTWLAARIYRAGVLMYGQKPSFGKLVKLAFSK